MIQMRVIHKLIACFVIIMLSGCAEIRLISEYDAYTDQNVTKIQRTLETLFTTLERSPTYPDCSHAEQEEDYAEIAVELNLLIARNELRPKNRITQDQLNLLKESLGELEKLHKESDESGKCMSTEEIQLLRSAFASSFGAILRLELAKKRNLETEE